MTDRTANLLDARLKVISLRRQCPDLRIQATDLIRCIENKLKAPDDPSLVEAFKGLAVPIVREIEGRI